MLPPHAQQEKDTTATKLNNPTERLRIANMSMMLIEQLLTSKANNWEFRCEDLELDEVTDPLLRIDGNTLWQNMINQRRTKSSPL